MQKLGLDLGSSSIGWALREDNKIEKRGVITFDTGMQKDQGGYKSPTRDRREARSKRRLLQARKYRKWALLEVLVEKKFVPLDSAELEVWSKYKKGQAQKFPENELFLKWLTCDFTYLKDGIKYNNPYELRVKALDNKLSNHELGRALYHLVQRRGYKNVGENENEEFDVELAKKDTETKKQIERRNEEGFADALNNNRTIAEALLNEFIDKDKRARNQYPLRREYRVELELICKGQGYDVSKNEKEEYKDALVQSLWNAIIWQRPLRSQKGNIGKCTLETTKPRCPVSHPVYEVFRAWSFINTIKYYNDQDEKQSLSQDFRINLFEFFLKKDKNFKFEEIRKFLDKQFGVRKQYNYPVNKEGVYDTSVSGMPVCKGLVDVCGDAVKEAISTIHQYNIGNAPKIIGNYSLYDLWHILFEFDETHLKTFAVQKLKIENEKKKKGEEFNPFAKLKNNIEASYSDLGLKATCKIIPFLKDGFLYNEAVVLAKLPELLGKKWETEKGKVFESIKQSNELYSWNKIIVGITNNLIDEYKGLVYPEVYAYKDFDYNIENKHDTEITKACIGYFGEKTWQSRNDKDEIFAAVKKEYQFFFKDQKRAYRELPTLTEIFKGELKEKKIELNEEPYHHSNRENIYGNTTFDKKTGIEILPEARIDSIKNPMFNKSMSILRKLVNGLILEGTIHSDTEIVIELARELNDNNKRAAIERYQKDRRDDREKYREFLNEFKEKKNKGMNVEESLSVFELWNEQTFEKTEDENKKPQTNKHNHEILKEKEAIKRYELWMEQKGQCMYTGKMISITQLFSNDIDIEHTIPRSLLPDNTMANQTVCYATYNRDKKKNQLPKQCENYSSDKEGWGTSIELRLNNWIKIRDGWKERYEKNIRAKGKEDEKQKNTRIQDKHFFKMHYDYWADKVKRFEADEVKDSWARRQLVDTQMTSKYAREFLRTYFKKVAVQKGIVTADFRKIYSFQEEDEIKSRNKHTHHAIDAAVLTLIPVNSSHRDKLLKAMYELDEREGKQYTTTPFAGFNSQELIRGIDSNTLIVNYENDKILKQTYRNVRKRGKLQYVKNKEGDFVLDKEGKKIMKTADGDAVRSPLFKDTFIAKIKDVERYSDGQPIREGDDWKYKQGKNEFTYVKRIPVNDAETELKNGKRPNGYIVDPSIRNVVAKAREQKKEPIDFQGKKIRHVRVYTSAGQTVKERINYRSNLEHKNHYYSSAGSLPYAIMLQKGNGGEVEREMIPIASFAVAKMNKKLGSFDIEQYIKEFYPDFATHNKQLLKIGQKVIVLNDDKEFEKRNEIDFQTKRLYVFTKFSDTDSSIWLKYHLEAQADDKIDDSVKGEKDALLRRYEINLGLPEVVEDITILNIKDRKDKYEKDRYSFKSYEDFRMKRLKEIIGLEKMKEIKKELDKFKTQSPFIEIEGKTPLLKMSNKNWNFLYEGVDFEISLLGKLNWVERNENAAIGNQPHPKSSMKNKIGLSE